METPNRSTDTSSPTTRRPSGRKAARKKLRQMQAEGGHALRMKVRNSDIKRLDQIKAFYREYCHLDPSNSILIRLMLEDLSRFIEAATARLKEGDPTGLIVSNARARLLAAVPDE